MAKSGTGPTIVPSGRTHVATIGSFTSTSAAHGSRESRNSCIQVLYIVAQSVSPSPPSSSTIGKSEPSGSRHGNAVSLEIGAFGSVIPSGQAVGSPVSGSPLWLRGNTTTATSEFNKCCRCIGGKNIALVAVKGCCASEWINLIDEAVSVDAARLAVVPSVGVDNDPDGVAPWLTLYVVVLGRRRSTRRRCR